MDVWDGIFGACKLASYRKCVSLEIHFQGILSKIQFGVSTNTLQIGRLHFPIGQQPISEGQGVQRTNIAKEKDTPRSLAIKLAPTLAPTTVQTSLLNIVPSSVVQDRILTQERSRKPHRVCWISVISGTPLKSATLSSLPSMTLELNCQTRTRINGRGERKTGRHSSSSSS